MSKIKFEWDEKKNEDNKRKHGVSFEITQYVFADSKRIIAEDITHSDVEKRYYCFGKIESDIITVRFTFRKNVIRLFGAGYWRKGKRIYEKENKIL